jgi:hypothetical protein
MWSCEEANLFALTVTSIGFCSYSLACTIKSEELKPGEVRTLPPAPRTPRNTDPRGANQPTHRRLRTFPRAKETRTKAKVTYKIWTP